MFSVLLVFVSIFQYPHCFCLSILSLYKISPWTQNTSVKKIYGLIPAANSRCSSFFHTFSCKYFYFHVCAIGHNHWCGKIYAFAFQKLLIQFYNRRSFFNHLIFFYQYGKSFSIQMNRIQADMDNNLHTLLIYHAKSMFCLCNHTDFPVTGSTHLTALKSKGNALSHHPAGKNPVIHFTYWNAVSVYRRIENQICFYNSRFALWGILPLTYVFLLNKNLCDKKTSSIGNHQSD